MYSNCSELFTLDLTAQNIDSTGAINTSDGYVALPKQNVACFISAWQIIRCKRNLE